MLKKNIYIIFVDVFKVYFQRNFYLDTGNLFCTFFILVYVAYTSEHLQNRDHYVHSKQY